MPQLSLKLYIILFAGAFICIIPYHHHLLFTFILPPYNKWYKKNGGNKEYKRWCSPSSIIYLKEVIDDGRYKI